VRLLGKSTGRRSCTIAEPIPVLRRNSIINHLTAQGGDIGGPLNQVVGQAEPSAWSYSVWQVL
jgi:hypothetical protein